MSFNKLKLEELTDVAEFFVVDVEVADEEKGATRKELIAALASGDEPVSWDDYQNVYLPYKAEQEAKTKTVPVPEPEPQPTPEPEPELTRETSTILKMERANSRFDIRGYTFTKEHPYRQVANKHVDYIVQNVEGFRIATPSEVADYYN